MSSDHLGSVSLTTNSYGQSAGVQEFDPWGKVRAGGLPQTKLNYTGQKLDNSELLYYHARYYDPVVGRFVSPDSIVPGASSGQGGRADTIGAVQNSKLTVDFHESGFASSVAGENAQTLQKGFWFQLSNDDKKIDIFGPDNPQALNRYSYVLNNPLRYTDPSGHDVNNGEVVNLSSKPIYVTGEIVDPTTKTGYRTVTYRVDPGYSSKDYGMVDADFFDTGYGDNVVKITGGTTATIYDDYSDPSGLGVRFDSKSAIVNLLLSLGLGNGLIYQSVKRSKAYKERYGNDYDYDQSDQRPQSVRIREHADQTTPKPNGNPRPIPCPIGVSCV